MVNVLIVTAIIMVTFYAVGYKSYKELSDITDKKEYPFKSVMAVGLGIRMLISIKPSERNNIIRLYRKRHNSMEYAYQRFEVFVGHLIGAVAFIILMIEVLLMMFEKYGNKEDFAMICAMLLVIGVASIVAIIRNETKNDKLRRELIEEELPVVLNKIIVLLKTGAPMENILTLIGENDSREYSNPIYEELRIVAYDIRNNKDIATSLDGMQKRCASNAVTRFVGAISQNIAKGTTECGDILMGISQNMWRDRKTAARTKGDSIKNKLMLSSALDMMIVFAIIVIPTFITLRTF